jgi:hypothetical protein
MWMNIAASSPRRASGLTLHNVKFNIEQQAQPDSRSCGHRCKHMSTHAEPQGSPRTYT